MDVNMKNKKSNNTIFGIGPEIIDRCVDQGSKGDGELYSLLHSGPMDGRLHVLHCTTTDSPLIYDQRYGHHWTADQHNRALMLVENVALAYENRAYQIGADIAAAAEKKEVEKQKSLELRRQTFHKKALSLRKKAGRAACYEFAASNVERSIAVTLDQFDQDALKLAGPNGVFYLDIGELEKGKPGDHCLRHTGCKLPEDIDMPTPPLWKKALWESLECQETIDFLQRFLGYCLTGSNQEQVTVVCDGDGANGKGNVSETSLTILGTYASPIQAEMLMDQGRGRAASAPSPDIMSLQGKRLVIASESDEARRFSPARLKWLTGGDTLVGRRPHDRFETYFDPTHKLMLYTNNLPHCPPDDYAFWRRIVRITWPFRFVKNPQKENEKKRDDRLLEKLKPEMTGILAWMIRGCLDWQLYGLQIPQKLKNNTEEYQKDEDTIQDWIDECCITEGVSDMEYARATELYDDFSAWWTKYHSKKVPSMHWFGRRMGRKHKRDKKEGVKVYRGIQLISS